MDPAQSYSAVPTSEFVTDPVSDDAEAFGDAADVDAAAPMDPAQSYSAVPRSDDDDAEISATVSVTPSFHPESATSGADATSAATVPLYDSEDASEPADAEQTDVRDDDLVKHRVSTNASSQAPQSAEAGVGEQTSEDGRPETAADDVSNE
jgi:hypothetical protein